jgi:hypothetical protein
MGQVEAKTEPGKMVRTDRNLPLFYALGPVGDAPVPNSLENDRFRLGQNKISFGVGSFRKRISA